MKGRSGGQVRHARACRLLAAACVMGGRGVAVRGAGRLAARPGQGCSFNVEKRGLIHR